MGRLLADRKDGLLCPLKAAVRDVYKEIGYGIINVSGYPSVITGMVTSRDGSESGWRVSLFVT